MPTYEYRCLDCTRRFSLFMTYAEYGQKQVLCPHCSSAHVQRKIGRVRIAQGESHRFDLETMSDPAALESLGEDPRALGKMMRTMSKEAGEDLGGEFHEVIDRLESGQSPEQIEQSMPDLGAADSPAGDDFA